MNLMSTVSSSKFCISILFVLILGPTISARLDKGLGLASNFKVKRDIGNWNEKKKKEFEMGSKS